MNINSVSPYQSVSYTKNADTKTDFNLANTFSISQSTENIKEANSQQVNSSNIWRELSNKYDVRNATFEEITEVSKALYDAGEISLKEVAILSFDYEKATRDLIHDATQQGIQISPNFSMYETKANEYGQRDWIKEFE